ncbi:hypothetical protein ACFFX0_06640 [Citricoccus parietis]|uniref:Uncharacterized protein n=1 Tax=Citricoccus parietis TaxID=592307 RepID=A0ABV5FW38_9MICC
MSSAGVPASGSGDLDLHGRGHGPQLAVLLGVEERPHGLLPFESGDLLGRVLGDAAGQDRGGPGLEALGRGLLVEPRGPVGVIARLGVEVRGDVDHLHGQQELPSLEGLEVRDVLIGLIEARPVPDRTRAGGPLPLIHRDLRQLLGLQDLDHVWLRPVVVGGTEPGGGRVLRDALRVLEEHPLVGHPLVVQQILVVVLLAGAPGLREGPREDPRLGGVGLGEPRGLLPGPAGGR